MRKYFKLLFGTIFICGIVLANQSCTSERDEFVPEDETEDIIPNEINSFSYSDLIEMRNQLKDAGVDVSDITVEEESDTRGIFISNPHVRAIKVKAKTLHPNRSGRYIDVSGVLLVPRKTLLTNFMNFRIAIVPPPTYTYNNSAPSIAFQNMSLVSSDGNLNFLYFWILQAQSGYIVFMPDYPGFGDSYGQCFHPYLDAEAMVNSTIDLFKVAQKTLSDNGYRYKNDLVISGYSLGGFVAASLAREMETNPAHGYSVSLLFTGGTPCNLKQIADIVRESDYVQHTYFLPYGLWGYKENAYPNINISDFLLEPYASKSKSYYNGTYPDVNDKFSHVPSEVYTSKFINDLDTDPSISYLNKILDDNSLKPWNNKCKFIMTHGVGDVSVYYQNAKDFAQEQQKSSGKVTFYSTIGDHVVGFLPYYSKASTYLFLNR